MVNELFIISLITFFSVILWWGFKTLPGERWQIIASLPTIRERHGLWRGINLTYYGLLTANAYVTAVAILCILLGSMGTPLEETFAVIVAILLICVPASKYMARIVEKKKHTFTVGGAFFVGMLVAPWMICLVNIVLGTRMDGMLQCIPALAAFIIAYAFGEGMGRLACISFGCCYGKSLSNSHPFFRRIFQKYCFMFTGETKKVAYEGGLEGVKVMPIQAVTAVLYITIGIIGVCLFTKSYYMTAFLLVIIVTQAWRSLSEMFRADFRGFGKITGYQMMAMISILYSLGLSYFWPSQSYRVPDAAVGVSALWDPAIILFLLVLWYVIFLYTGRSAVTGSTLTFYVNKDRV
ncbi:MAG: prolipoprotein diacylglyceryl transferase [Candidatus Brocadiaceae bacterium]|nr:prolipoprotein diacylglyceryl transferase [Candidatus Brocadiaceae bacterium]